MPTQSPSFVPNEPLFTDLAAPSIPVSASRGAASATAISGAATATHEPVREQRPLEPKRARRRATLAEQMSNPLILAEDPGQLTFEADRIKDAFQPRNGWQDYLVSAIATLLFRINRSDRIERKLRDMASFRAFDLWEEDQALAVEHLVVRLPKQPSRIVAQLRDTPAGIHWLIRRWETLDRVDPAAWNDAERDLAGLLLGGINAIDPTEPGLARTRINELRDLLVKVEHTDAIIRSLVEADLCDEKVPGLNRLRRYTRSLQRDLKWHVDQFHVEHPPAPIVRPRLDLIATEPDIPLDDVDEPVDATKPFAAPAGDETEPLLDRDEDATKPLSSRVGGEPSDFRVAGSRRKRNEATLAPDRGRDQAETSQATRSMPFQR